MTHQQTTTGDDQGGPGQTGPTRNLAEQQHSRQQAHRGLVGVDRAGQRKVRMLNRLNDQHVARDRQRGAEDDVEPEALQPRV